MDSIEILKKMKLIETFRLDIGNEKSKIFKELKRITDRDYQHFSAGVDKTNKRYVGQVGTDFFDIRPRDTYHSQLDVYAHGKVIEGQDKTQLEIQINGFHKKWIIQFPIVFSIFAIIVLWVGDSFATRIFLCVTFFYLFFGCIALMWFNKKKFKNRLVKDLKSV